MLKLEMKQFHFIFVTSCNVSARSMEILSLYRTSFLPLSDTMQIMNKHSECIVTYIQVISGGLFRCVIQNHLNFCTDGQSQESLKLQQPGATVLPLLVSSDKTCLTVFGGKQAYLVYMTIGNIPKEICRRPSCYAQMLIGYIPTTMLQGISNKSSHKHAVTNLFHFCM